MTWSTRQLADLAGTTVKAVRHYHDVGLLDVPERSSNGYKQYQVVHLVRLLQIKRLTDLGVPLAQIATMGSADQESVETIRSLYADVEANIERLQRVRSELGEILLNQAPVDVPAEFGDVADGLSQADRALIMVYSRVLSEDALRDLREMLRDRDPVDDEFDALPPDADPETIESLARRMAPDVRRQEAQFPWIADRGAFGPRGRAFGERTVSQALVALYNPAQLQVMKLVHAIVHPESDAATE